MKNHLGTLFVLLCLPAISQAEYRIMAVEVFKAKDNSVKINVYSEVKTEAKKSIAVKDATTIMKNAQGWGSGVGVAIVSENVDLSSFISIVDAVAKNPWLDLALLRSKRNDMGEHILRHFKIDAKPKTIPAADSGALTPPKDETRKLFGAKVREAAVAMMLERLPDLGIIDCFAPSLKREKASAALSSVKRVGADKEAVDALLNVPEDDRKGAWVLALSSFGDDRRVKPELLKLAKNAESHLRIAAIDALGYKKFQSDESIVILTDALDNDYWVVVMHAAMSLGRHGAKAETAVPRLIRALDVDDGYVAWQAAEALGRIGPKAKDALPRLRELAANGSGLEADAAKEAIPLISEIKNKQPARAKL